MQIAQSVCMLYVVCFCFIIIIMFFIVVSIHDIWYMLYFNTQLSSVASYMWNCEITLLQYNKLILKCMIASGTSKSIQYVSCHGRYIGWIFCFCIK